MIEPTRSRLSMDRRLLLAGVGAGAVALVTPRRRTSAQIEPLLQSGGIGLTRSASEVLFAFEDMPVGGPGDDAWTQMYGTVGEQYASNYLAFREIGDEPVCVFIEYNNLPPDGSTPGDIAKAVAFRMPADARLVESTVAPWTPAGEIALRIERYVSAVLAEVTGGALPGEIVVVRQERWSDGGGVLVTSFAITAREIS